MMKNLASLCALFVSLCTLITVFSVIGGCDRQENQTDFVLTGTQHLDIIRSYDIVVLQDSSTADIFGEGSVKYASVNDNALLRTGAVIGTASLYNDGRLEVRAGRIDRLNAYDTSTVEVRGGHVEVLVADGSSNVSLLRGTVDGLLAEGGSNVSISGGGVLVLLYADGTTSVSISGGYVQSISVSDVSTVMLLGHDFRGSGDVSLIELKNGDGTAQYEVIGTGQLTGKWSDGTQFVLDIEINEETATILASGLPPAP